MTTARRHDSSACSTSLATHTHRLQSKTAAVVESAVKNAEKARHRENSDRDLIYEATARLRLHVRLRTGRQYWEWCVLSLKQVVVRLTRQKVRVCCRIGFLSGATTAGFVFTIGLLCSSVKDFQKTFALDRKNIISNAFVFCCCCG